MTTSTRIILDRDQLHQRDYHARILKGCNLVDDPEQVAWDVLMYSATHTQVQEAAALFDNLAGFVQRGGRA